MTRAARATELTDVPDLLWSRFASAPHRALFLDYDGTLAPFRERREEARPTAHALWLVQEIASRGETTIAIVSGRPIASLIEMLGPLPVGLIGEHGWEWRTPDGRLERYALPEEGVARLQHAAAAAEREGLGEHLERKRASLVLHTRGLSSQQAEQLLQAARGAWEELTRWHGMLLDQIHGGLELRVSGREKGIAVREILNTLPASTLAVYIGDDVTDEDAFREVAASGFGILVGQPVGTTFATGLLASIPAVERFLERWLAEACPAPRSGKRP